uniref:Reverse transcriptase domain-containing protein n=1 Tax=Cannabis sativa TaxID=3483 RepID=A0A803PT85_CANSA
MTGASAGAYPQLLHSGVRRLEKGGPVCVRCMKCLYPCGVVELLSNEAACSGFSKDKNSNAQLATVTDTSREPSTGQRGSIDTPLATVFNTGSFEPGETSKGKSRRKKLRGAVSSTRRMGLQSRKARLGEEKESPQTGGRENLKGAEYSGVKYFSYGLLHKDLHRPRGRGFGRMEGELLQNFLMDCDGIDLGYIGQSYAWYNARNAESRVRKRLDRAVACPEWCTHFPHASVKHFPIVNSDHAPLILDSRLSLQKHRYPFRFLEVWKSDNTCGKTIEKVWVTPCDGHRSFCVVKKLHLAKNALKRWNHDCFGFFNKKLRELYSRLAYIQNAPITPGFILEEDQIQIEILDLEKKMERIWKQKSRELWVKQGDCNSKFFHTATILQRRKNHIYAINDHGDHWLQNCDDIGNYFVENFKTLFTSSHPIMDADFMELYDTKVLTQENEDFCRVPSFSEIKAAVYNLHPLKAPGPDGFQELNHTFICLIPKKESPSRFEQFRPISLCNFGYKVIARPLTDQLKPILEKLISPFQHAFLKGRWIAEGFVLAAEALHTMQKIGGKKCIMAVKTDMHKAYDRIEWDFLHKVLLANGFSAKVCSLLMQCVTSVSFSVLLNGAPLKQFRPGQGLRQGDPLSPYLFILCSEVCSALRKEISDSLQIPPLSCKEKYLVDKRGNDSSLWKGILEARDLCVPGAGILIGKGDIDLWTKPWVPGFSLEEVRGSFTYAITHKFSSVSDLFLPRSQTWDVNLIRACFSHDVAEAIIRIKPLEGDEDRVFWKSSNKGLFSVKNAYWLSQCHRLWFQCPWGLLTGNQQFDSFESLFLWLNNLGDPIMLRYAAYETKAISCQAVCYVHSVLEAELEAIHLALVVAIEERYSSVFTPCEENSVADRLAYLARVNNVCKKSVGRETVPLVTAF